LLVKDVRGRPMPFRVLGARVHLRHEYRTLRRLSALPGIPRLFGMIDRDALAMEYIDARPLSEVAGGLDPPTRRLLFERLKDLVHAMHRAGVAHGDIRGRNILVDCQGNPYLIDFGTAIVQDARPRWLHRRLQGLAARIDELTVLKLQARYCPVSLTDEEREQLQRFPWYLRLGRFLRHDVYRAVIKQKRWRERWNRLRSIFGCGGPVAPCTAPPGGGNSPGEEAGGAENSGVSRNRGAP